MIVWGFVTNFGGIEQTGIMGNITFQSADRSLTLPNRRGLKTFIATLIKREGHQLEGINYVFCSDAFLLDINQRFLQHDYYTDIITFGLSEPGMPIEAEIYISVDRVKDNAKREGSTFRTEMLRVILHGALHLCGYKDKSSKQVKEMRGKEDEYLSLYTRKRGK